MGKRKSKFGQGLVHTLGYVVHTYTHMIRCAHNRQTSRKTY